MSIFPIYCLTWSILKLGIVTKDISYLAHKCAPKCQMVNLSDMGFSVEWVWKQTSLHCSENSTPQCHLKHPLWMIACNGSQFGRDGRDVCALECSEGLSGNVRNAQSTEACFKKVQTNQRFFISITVPPRVRNIRSHFGFKSLSLPRL